MNRNIQKIRYKDREEWLELRKGLGLGGSEAAAALGLDEYKSPYALWSEKTGRVPGFDGNLTTRVGSYLEELVARLWSEETGKKVRRENAILVNPDYPCSFADVDRLVVGERALLECKTTSSLPVMRRVRGGEFPDRWYCQMMHYMMVTGLDRAYLAVLVNGREFYHFQLDRDEDEIAAMAAAEKDFWACVQQDLPPALDGAEATGQALGEVYPGGLKETVELPGYAAKLDEMEAIKNQLDALKERREQLQNEVKNGMGDCEKALCGRWKVSWATQSRRTLDTKALQAAYPQVDLEPFYKTTTSRVFRAKQS